tara:strand:+ start:4986 stop:5900 length:915 start_codon:yes stop_codon:yes gene_type:complete
MHIDTSLLREKFSIKEQKNDTPLTIKASSNRMVLNLQAGELPTETFVVRTNSMHSCTRITALIIADYEKTGPLATRIKSIDWKDMWDKALNDYERRYNPDRWLAIYHQGKPVFFYGHYHSFLNVIEHCDFLNKGDYAKSIELAETAFKKAGKIVTIDYTSNVALVAIIGRGAGRCSMILRAPNHTTTFNYTLKPINAGDNINLTQGLSSAGDFLEGVQLAYLIGINTERLNQELIEKFSDEAKQTHHARERLNQLDAQINSMENRYKVRYRPERPMFDFIIGQAEKYARANPIESSGEDEIYIE